MREVNVQLQIDVDADSAWAVLADFAGFLNWAGGADDEITIEGDGIGMVRHLKMGVGEMGERLIELNDETRTLGYSLVYGEPIGMKEYQALVQVNELDDGRTEIGWHGQFQPLDPAAEEQVAASLVAAFEGMTQALVAYIAQQ